MLIPQQEVEARKGFQGNFTSSPILPKTTTTTTAAMPHTTCCILQGYSPEGLHCINGSPGICISNLAEKSKRKRTEIGSWCTPAPQGSIPSFHTTMPLTIRSHNVLFAFVQVILCSNIPGHWHPQNGHWCHAVCNVIKGVYTFMTSQSPLRIDS